MQICPNFTAIATCKSKTENEILLTHLRCKQWACEYCAQKNREIWRAHLLETLNKKIDGCNWVFITLTAHENARSKYASCINLKTAWGKLYHRIKRKWSNQVVEYVMLYEPHKDSALHIHGILNLEVEGNNVWDAKTKKWYHPALTHWLKDNARQCGAGYMAHGAKIEPDRAYVGQPGNAGLVVAYITKYITKDNQGWDGYPKYFHRIAVSRNIGSPPRKETDTVWHMRVGVHMSELEGKKTVINLNTGEIRTRKGATVLLDIQTGERIARQWFIDNEVQFYPKDSESETKENESI